MATNKEVIKCGENPNSFVFNNMLMQSKIRVLFKLELIYLTWPTAHTIVTSGRDAKYSDGGIADKCGDKSTNSVVCHRQNNKEKSALHYGGRNNRTKSSIDRTVKQTYDFEPKKIRCQRSKFSAGMNHSCRLK